MNTTSGPWGKSNRYVITLSVLKIILKRTNIRLTASKTQEYCMSGELNDHATGFYGLYARYNMP